MKIFLMVFIAFAVARSLVRIAILKSGKTLEITPTDMAFQAVIGAGWIIWAAVLLVEML